MPRYLITSGLPYINGVHLGNLAGSQLPADVYARFLRLRGEEVLYICGTDEHGTPAELAAAKANDEVSEYCRRQHDVHKGFGGDFDLSFDHFGRSSSKQNRELTQAIAKKLEENGYIEEREVRQLYSPADGRFLPDRYVVGTCPHCGHDPARGDQCDGCTHVLDPLDLINPRSAISGSDHLEVRTSRHLFLLQSRLADTLRTFVDEHDAWPPLVRSIALKWLDEGLEDRCITRDLAWGIPVDRPGFEGKVFYVWFDAPIAYIAATREWADADPAARDWKRWWYDADDVHYVQFMGKDNVPFHTITFPAALLGTGEPWKFVDYIKGLNWLTYCGGKFSTSDGRGVFLEEALELLPSDYWRYYLIAHAPESNDSDFSWEHFAAVVNKDLADVFGNFVNRTLRFASSRFGSQIPEGGEWTDEESRLADALRTRIAEYTENLDRLHFRKAVQELRAIWSLGNGYLERLAPWRLIKTEPERAACVVRAAINLVRIFSVLASPLIPATADKVLAALEIEPEKREWIQPDLTAELTRLAPGRSFSPPEVLFEKIDEDRIAAWKTRFGE